MYSHLSKSSDYQKIIKRFILYKDNKKKKKKREEIKLQTVKHTFRVLSWAPMNLETLLVRVEDLPLLRAVPSKSMASSSKSSVVSSCLYNATRCNRMLAKQEIHSANTANGTSRPDHTR